MRKEDFKMIIVSQDKKVLINFNNVTGIQVDDKSIGVQLVSEDSLYVGEYETEEDAKVVLQNLITTMINKGIYEDEKVFYMPEK